MTSNILLNPDRDQEKLSTKEKMLLAGIRLFSDHGFEATTTRMLADAVGSNNAVVYSHFGTKENFYSEVLNAVAESIQTTFQPLQDEITGSRNAGPFYPNAAWFYIEKYVDMYIDIIKNPDNNRILYLLLHEQTNPVNDHRPITRVACQQGELMLVQLLFDYWQITDRLSTLEIYKRAVHSLPQLRIFHVYH